MAAYRDVILADPNLVVYWRLGEASGNFADSGPNGVTGTAVLFQPFHYGKAGSVLGDTDKAAEFDGVTYGNYISLGTTDVLMITTQGAVEFVVKLPPAGSGGTHPIYFRRASNLNTGSGMSIGINNANKVFLSVRDAGAGSDTTTMTTALTVDVYAHIILTWNNVDGKRVYFNGALDGTNTNTRHPDNYSGIAAYIGRNQENNGWLTAIVDEFSMYNAFFTASRVSDHYNAFISGEPPAGAAAQSRLLLRVGR